VLKLLYDEEVVGEEACLAWADEKAHADDSDKVYLNKCAAFIQWLREAEDEDEDEEEESD
jgi:translation initiation factor eIF-2B subunit epsilon